MTPPTLPSILYVGSETAFPDRLQTLLARERDGAVSIETATSGEVVERVGDEPIACVVADEPAAETDGLALLREIRAIDDELPVFLRIRDGPDSLVNEALEAGVTDYVWTDDPTAGTVLAKRVSRELAASGGADGDLATALLDATTDHASVVDESGEITYVSPTASRMFGYDADDLVGTNAFELVHPADRSTAVDELTVMLDDPTETAAIEFRIERADGSYCWVECRGRNHLDDPAIDGLVVSLRDISERKAKEQELHRFRQAVEHAGHAIYITTVNGIIEYVNPAFEASTGYSADEAIGRTPTILKSGEQDESFYERLWETILAGDVWEGEVTNERKDGQQYVIDQTIAPITDADGEIEWFVAINNDITRRKAYEQRLGRYETIIDNLPVGVYRTTPGPDGTFVEVNDALVSLYDAYSADELLGADVSQFYADPAERAAFSDKLQSEGSVREEEVEQTTLTGESIHVSLTAIKTVDDGEVYFDGILTDVTDRKRREHELERQNERLEQFASFVTHDLRNPLNVAQSRLDLAMRECDTDHLDVLDTQLVRMEELIEDVLAIARHGQQVDATTRIELGPLAEGCWETVDTNGASLHVDSDRPLAVDTARFQQLLENLYRNAIEHGGEDVTVHVGSMPDGFYIADDGPGIDPEVRDDVFDHGYTTEHDGTGFGLSIVKEIVDAHGWEVAITESADGGARFEFTGVDDLPE